MTELPQIPGIKYEDVRDDYPEYGLTSAGIALEGTADSKTGRRFVFKTDKETGKPIWRADVSNRYALFANEKAIEVADKAADTLGFKQFKVMESRGGNVVNAMYLAKEANWGTGSHYWVEAETGDVINLGFSVRNSIDASTAFGADLFSFRRMCSNGAIVGLKKLTGTMILRRHVGQVEEFMGKFSEALTVFLKDNMEPFAQFYKSLSKIRLNLEVAKAIAPTIPSKYLPDYIEVTRKTHDVTLAKDAPQNVYKLYNDITQALWHSDRVEARSQTTYTTNLHKVLEPLVARVV